MKKGLIVFGLFIVVFSIMLFNDDKDDKVIREIIPSNSYDGELVEMGIPKSVVDIMPFEQKEQILSYDYKYLGMGYESQKSYTTAAFGQRFDYRKRLDDDNFTLTVLVFKDLIEGHERAYAVYVNYLWENPPRDFDVSSDFINFPIADYFYSDWSDTLTARQYVLLGDTEYLIDEEYKYSNELMQGFKMKNFKTDIRDDFKGYAGYLQVDLGENGDIDNLEIETIYTHTPSNIDNKIIKIGSIQFDETNQFLVEERVITTIIKLWNEEER